MKKFWTKEVKIGLTGILCLFILFAGIQFLKGINIAKPANHYIVTFDDVSELMVSSPVTVDGYKVGVVHDMKYDYENNGKVQVMINLDKELRIPRDSKITLSKGLMGGATIIIDMNPYVSEYYKSGDTIEGTAGNDLFTSVGNMMPQVTEVLVKVDSILTGVQTLVNDPALLASVQRLDGITANLESSTTQLDKVLRNDVPLLMSNVKSITSNVDTLTGTLNTLPIEHTVAQLNQLLSNIEDATSSLKKTDNTAGLLLNDPELYNSLNGAVSSLDSLLNDIKENPKRYINIKVF